MIQRKGASVVEFVDNGGVKVDTEFKMQESDFMIAFSLFHKDAGVRADPRFVRFVAELHQQRGLQRSSLKFPLHVCSEDEFSRFFEIDSVVAKKVD